MNKIEFIAAFLLFAYCTTSSHHFVSSAMSSPPPSANTNPNTNNAAAAKGVIDFLTQARGLKTTKRTGWVRQEAGPQIESVADHSWR